jgi:hypothetical protein
VTCIEELPADVVQLIIRPAARIGDRGGGPIVEEHRFWLVLADRDGKELAWTTRSYSWASVVDLAAKFERLSPSRAMSFWKLNDL